MSGIIDDTSLLRKLLKKSWIRKSQYLIVQFIEI